MLIFFLPLSSASRFQIKFLPLCHAPVTMVNTDPNQLFRLEGSFENVEPFSKGLVSAVLVVMWNSLTNIFVQDACAQILVLLSVCFCSVLRTPALFASLLKLQKLWFSPVHGELDSPFKKTSGKLFFLYSLYCICLLLLLLVAGTKRKR